MAEESLSNKLVVRRPLISFEDAIQLINWCCGVGETGVGWRGS